MYVMAVIVLVPVIVACLWGHEDDLLPLVGLPCDVQLPVLTNNRLLF